MTAAIEKIVAELKTELDHSKDVIWRLDTRVFVLEKEVKDLKAVIRYARKTTPSSGSALSTAKRGEIARRKNKFRKKQDEETEQFASSSSSSQTACTKNLSSQSSSQSPIKMERLDDPSDEYSDADGSMSSMPEESSHGNQMSIVPFASRTVVSDGREGQKRLRIGKRKSGRKQDEIWTLFSVTQMSDLQKQARCLKCGHITNWAKVENLRVHVARCQKHYLSKYDKKTTKLEIHNNSKSEISANEMASNKSVAAIAAPAPSDNASVLANNNQIVAASNINMNFSQNQGVVPLPQTSTDNLNLPQVNVANLTASTDGTLNNNLSATMGPPMT